MMAGKTTKTKAKKAYKKRAPRRKMRATGVPEWASASLTRSLINPAGGAQPTIFNPNVTYRFYDCSIDQFPRAVPIASAYQQYRVKRISLKFRPLVDSFIAGGGETVPQLYHQIDKLLALSPNVGLPAMKTMGCVPRRLDDKNLTTSWAPGVLDAATDTLQGGLTFAKVNISPWLNTSDNPFVFPVTVSSVDHLGIIWNVEQLVGGSGNYTVECTIEVQFRKPSFEPSEGDMAAVSMKVQ